MLYFLLVLLGSIFIRKRFDFSLKYPQIDGFLKISWLISLLILLSGNFVNDKIGISTAPVWFLFIGFVLYCYWLARGEPKPDAIIWSTIGFLVISIIFEISEAYFDSFHEDISSYLSVGQLGTFISIIAFGIGISNQQKALAKEKEKSELISKQNDELEELVSERTAEITKQKEELVVAMEELKATQSQLIQSEKMASLGELTAGIAHEIQNPLNFVNNFSEVSSEMIDDMNEELENGDLEEVKAIAADLKLNLGKIYHHGNRASSIVKGMLEHSRASSGKKELTDINVLADEYLRLSYHGLRAKDKSFNAEIITDLDPNLPKINIVSQDVGRVLLNLINNAFQSCTERNSGARTENYMACVTVSTKTQKDNIVIAIKDNGLGIPTEIRDKIFQPFFTTKDTGKGTGLGLSLSNEIIKAHGGEISLKTKVNEGTKFIITLPIS